jgi:replicative DNA helicase
LNIKRSHAKKGTRVFFIDHLWLILSNKNDTKNNLIWEYTSKLKNLAMELDVAIIALSQLNRGDSKENKPPSLSSLRDSWNIEQDADVVILLHRERDEDGKMWESVKMRVMKNRVNGIMQECIAEIDNDNFRLF